MRTRLRGRWILLAGGRKSQTQKPNVQPGAVMQDSIPACYNKAVHHAAPGSFERKSVQSRSEVA